MRTLATMLAGAAALALWGAGADAKTFRYATSGDLLGLDPHLNNEALTNGFKGNVYEGLITRSPDLKLEPGLATSWTQTSPTTWRRRCSSRTCSATTPSV